MQRISNKITSRLYKQIIMILNYQILNEEVHARDARSILCKYMEIDIFIISADVGLFFWYAYHHNLRSMVPLS